MEKNGIFQSTSDRVRQFGGRSTSDRVRQFGGRYVLLFHQWADYLLTGSHCATFDGVEDALLATHLTGSETVVSYSGNSTPTISAGRIDFTAGTMYNLILSDGTHYAMAEGLGTTIFDTSGGGNHGTAVNTDDATFWGSTQDGYHHNLTKGFSKTQDVRVPTEAELTADTLYATTAPVTNRATALSSFLKLPVAGFRSRDSGAMAVVGNAGRLWSGTASGSSARGVGFSGSGSGIGNNSRAYGFSVRLIVREDSTLSAGDTLTLDGLTYGVIASPSTGRLWLDRNLGATQVATSSTDTASYGDYYQFGRVTDGHEKSGSTTTAILSGDVVNVGSAFIRNATNPYDWTTADSSGGMRESINSANIPSLTDGTADALGRIITNPALIAPNSNGAETAIGGLS